MSDTSLSEEQLESLRHRWNLEKTPRVLLQLADEYRRNSRSLEAIDLLMEGLELHPGHLSFRIAMGRCRLASGDAQGAIEILETVTSSDPTQLVANKALLQAYLLAQQADKAQARLLHYSLLAAGDPDLESLTEAVKRVVAGQAPEAAAVALQAGASHSQSLGSVSEFTATPAGSDPRAPGPSDALGDPFGSLGGVQAAAETPGGEDIFQVEPPPPVVSPATSWKPSASDLPASVKELRDIQAEQIESVAVEPPAQEEALSPTPTGIDPPQDEPFGVGTQDSTRWARALEAEGIFDLGMAAEPISEAVSSESAPAAIAQPTAADPLLDLTEPPPEAVPANSQSPESLAEVPLPEMPLPETPIEASLSADELSLEDSAPQEPDSADLPPGPEAAFLDRPSEDGGEGGPPQLPQLPQLEEVEESMVVADQAPSPQDSEEYSDEDVQEEVSATLGMLYLRQEHYGEARDIFSRVAQGQEPGSPASRRVELLRPVPDEALTAQQLLAGSFATDSSSKNKDLLESYLAQIRSKVPRRVS